MKHLIKVTAATAALFVFTESHTKAPACALLPRRHLLLRLRGGGVTNGGIGSKIRKTYEKIGSKVNDVMNELEGTDKVSTDDLSESVEESTIEEDTPLEHVQSQATKSPTDGMVTNERGGGRSVEEPPNLDDIMRSFNELTPRAKDALWHKGVKEASKTWNSLPPKERALLSDGLPSEFRRDLHTFLELVATKDAQLEEAKARAKELSELDNKLERRIRGRIEKDNDNSRSRRRSEDDGDRRRDRDNISDSSDDEDSYHRAKLDVIRRRKREMEELRVALRTQQTLEEARAAIISQMGTTREQSGPPQNPPMFSETVQVMPAPPMQPPTAKEVFGALAHFCCVQVPQIFIGHFCMSLGSVAGMWLAKEMMARSAKGSPMKGNKKPVGFQDVIGCDEAKTEVQQVVDFLQSPEKYSTLGAHIPRGILLVGPPGTGKTLLAKACAGEAGVPFLYSSGSDYNAMFAGQGVSMVKQQFKAARKLKKCILFIDEIDYVGKKRSSGHQQSLMIDREATLTQLLAEMDGFSQNDGIVIIGTTNRPDTLDEALTRSGRFGMIIQVDPPDRAGREGLFIQYLKKLKIAGKELPEAEVSETTARRVSPIKRLLAPARKCNKEAEKEERRVRETQAAAEELAVTLSGLTPGMVGADIEHVCNVAGLLAAKDEAEFIALKHFSAAIDRVSMGLEKKSKIMPEHVRNRTAIHEAGHAVVSWNLAYASVINKVSIIWRGDALGFTQSLPDERHGNLKDHYLDQICVLMAGRAAEEVLLGQVTDGCSHDLKTATKLALDMVTRLGFGKSLGLVTAEYTADKKSLSAVTSREIDKEIQGILRHQYSKAKRLIGGHRDEIENIRTILLREETIHEPELKAILGEKVTPEIMAARKEAAKEEAKKANGKELVQSAPTSQPKVKGGMAKLLPLFGGSRPSEQ